MTHNKEALQQQRKADSSGIEVETGCKKSMTPLNMTPKPPGVD